MKWLLDRKIERKMWASGLTVLITAFIVIACSVKVFNDNARILNGTEENRISNVGDNITLSSNFVNFSVDSSFNNSVNPSFEYPSYCLSIIQLDDKTANTTMLNYFGNVIFNSTLKVNTNSKEHVYTVGGNTIYTLGPDNIITYLNMSPHESFTEEMIKANESLVSSDEARAIAEDYIKDRIGDEFNDFIFLRQACARTYTTDNSTLLEKITKYKFFYSRLIDNITCFDNGAGQIIVWVSPDGTILSFVYQNFNMSKYLGDRLPDLTNSVKKVDDNFADYSRHLFAGFANYTLFKAEPAYGRVDDTMVIGWRLFFYCDNDDTIVTDTFVY